MRTVIVTPATSEANNGNWRTARRWQRALAPLGPTRIVQRWPDQEAMGDEVMLALHARRSAEAIAAWHARRGSAGLGVVLTGTDLHGDLADPAARHSLSCAQALVVLHERGVHCLPAGLRSRARVILQSATPRQTLEKSPRLLRAVMVGHLREVKSPTTLFAAARLLARHLDLRIDHIGGSLDPSLGALAEATMTDCPGYRWLGGLPYPEVRRRIQGAHLLVHASRTEGGAHAIIEAVTSGTPVIASRVEGNLGLLGSSYAGYFPWDDAEALAALLLQCRATQASRRGLLARLRRQIARRAPLLAPQRERRLLQALVRELAWQPGWSTAPLGRGTV